MAAGPEDVEAGMAVAAAVLALVGVETLMVGDGVAVGMAGSMVAVVPASGVPGVPVVTGVPPPAAAVCAASVCLANCSIISMGFSTEAIGETNNPVAIGVAVTIGASETDISQAERMTAAIMKTDNVNILRWFLIISSPDSFN